MSSMCLLTRNTLNSELFPIRERILMEYFEPLVVAEKKPKRHILSFQKLWVNWKLISN